jgi:hypothetical protein
LEVILGKGYIRIETKPGGQLYATHFVSKRAGGKVVNSTQYLGIPVDIEKGLFKAANAVFSILIWKPDLLKLVNPKKILQNIKKISLSV